MIRLIVDQTLNFSANLDFEPLFSVADWTFLPRTEERIRFSSESWGHCLVRAVEYGADGTPTLYLTLLRATERDIAACIEWGFVFKSEMENAP